MMCEKYAGKDVIVSILNLTSYVSHGSEQRNLQFEGVVEG
jgi:hypothetical protein